MYVLSGSNELPYERQQACCNFIIVKAQITCISVKTALESSTTLTYDWLTNMLKMMYFASTMYITQVCNYYIGLLIVLYTCTTFISHQVPALIHSYLLFVDSEVTKLIWKVQTKVKGATQ